MKYVILVSIVIILLRNIRCQEPKSKGVEKMIMALDGLVDPDGTIEDQDVQDVLNSLFSSISCVEAGVSQLRCIQCFESHEILRLAANNSTNFVRAKDVNKLAVTIIYYIVNLEKVCKLENKEVKGYTNVLNNLYDIILGDSKDGHQILQGIEKMLRMIIKIYGGTDNTQCLTADDLMDEMDIKNPSAQVGKSNIELFHGRLLYHILKGRCFEVDTVMSDFIDNIFENYGTMNSDGQQVINVKNLEKLFDKLKPKAVDEHDHGDHSGHDDHSSHQEHSGGSHDDHSDHAGHKHHDDKDDDHHHEGHVNHKKDSSESHDHSEEHENHHHEDHANHKNDSSESHVHSEEHEDHSKEMSHGGNTMDLDNDESHDDHDHEGYKNHKKGLSDSHDHSEEHEDHSGKKDHGGNTMDLENDESHDDHDHEGHKNHKKESSNSHDHSEEHEDHLDEKDHSGNTMNLESDEDHDEHDHEGHKNHKKESSDSHDHSEEHEDHLGEKAQSGNTVNLDSDEDHDGHDHSEEHKNQTDHSEQSLHLEDHSSEMVRDGTTMELGTHEKHEDQVKHKDLDSDEAHDSHENHETGEDNIAEKKMVEKSHNDDAKNPKPHGTHNHSEEESHEDSEINNGTILETNSKAPNSTQRGSIGIFENKTSILNDSPKTARLISTENGPKSEMSRHNHTSLASKCWSTKQLHDRFSLNENGITKKTFVRICPALIQQAISGVCEESHDQVPKKMSNIEIYGYSTLAAIIISLASLSGLILIPIMKRGMYQYIMSGFVALAFSTLVGDAILHLLPQALKLHDHSHGHAAPEPVTIETIPEHVWVLLAVIGAIYGLFLFELILSLCGGKHSHSSNHGHSHIPDASVLPQGVYKKKTESKEMLAMNNSTVTLNMDLNNGPSNGKESDEVLITSTNLCGKFTTLAMIILVGDTMHNFADGLAMGAAFSNSMKSGLSTSVAIFFHELPHEFGDFVVLLSTGLSVKMTALCNLVSSFMSFLGLYLGLWLGQDDRAQQWILAVTAGIFLYIAMVEMLPELKNLKCKNKTKMFLVQNFGALVGFGIMVVIALYEDQIQI